MDSLADSRSSNGDCANLLRMVAEATRHGLLNAETITNALHNVLSTEDLIYTMVASDMIEACYQKLLSEVRYNVIHSQPVQEHHNR